MSSLDRRGNRISGANPAALDAYEHALAAFVSWRKGTGAQVQVALQHAPEFVMAHVLQAYLVLSSRDQERVRSAGPVLARAMVLPAQERERAHLAAIAAVLGDDYELAKLRLGEVLRIHPRDILALQMAHALDYVTGDTARLHDRVAAVLPAWSNDLPDHHAVLAMHAFGLEERGDYGRAEDTARAALLGNAYDARAHHVMAHVFEMTDRAETGVHWMNDHREHWSVDSGVATHCWWHVGLFHLAQGRLDRALAVYDRHILPDHAGDLADLIDAAALLWRVRLAGGDAGARWRDLAAAWAHHADDRFCSFSDMHAMLAFVGEEDWARAERFERALEASALQPTRYGRSTHQLGLPACRALLAFGRGDHAVVRALLGKLPQIAHRLGGSHAQLDVLHLTLQQSIERLRLPGLHPIGASLPIAA